MLLTSSQVWRWCILNATTLSSFEWREQHLAHQYKIQILFATLSVENNTKCDGLWRAWKCRVNGRASEVQEQQNHLTLQVGAASWPIIILWWSLIKPLYRHHLAHHRWANKLTNRPFASLFYLSAGTELMALSLSIGWLASESINMFARSSLLRSSLRSHRAKTQSRILSRSD